MNEKVRQQPTFAYALIKRNKELMEIELSSSRLSFAFFRFLRVFSPGVVPYFECGGSTIGDVTDALRYCFRKFKT